MSYVTINAVTVPDEHADEFERRFGARAGQVDKVPGFREFKLLRPTDDREQWLVYTAWDDKASFDAWVDSDAFREAHSGDRAKGPVGTHSELWAYEEVQQEASDRS